MHKQCLGVREPSLLWPWWRRDEPLVTPTKSSIYRIQRRRYIYIIIIYLTLVHEWWDMAVNVWRGGVLLEQFWQKIYNIHLHSIQPRTFGSPLYARIVHHRHIDWYCNNRWCWSVIRLFNDAMISYLREGTLKYSSPSRHVFVTCAVWRSNN